MRAILSVQQLSLSMGGKSLCDALDWALRPAEVWGVLGLNGVGKSTLLHSLCGLHPPDSGQISLATEPLQQMSRRAIARKVGLLFQHQDDIFPVTVLEQVMMGRHPHISMLGGEQPADLEIVERVIEKMALSGLESRLVDTLSGGERRRVAVATILAQQPQLYLLDEPEAHLDPRHQKAALAAVVADALQREGGVVMALHDINLAIRHCTHLLLLYGGGEVEQGALSEMVTLERVERLYETGMRRIEEGGQIAYLVR